MGIVELLDKGLQPCTHRVSMTTFIVMHPDSMMIITVMSCDLTTITTVLTSDPMTIITVMELCDDYI